MYQILGLLFAASDALTAKWITLWVALTAGVLAILLVVVKAYFESQSKKQDAQIKADEHSRNQDDSHAQTYSAMAEYVRLSSTINPIMTELMTEGQIDRISILKTENGGGKPEPGSAIYTTIAWEVVDPPAMPVLGLYSRQRLDALFVEVMAEAYTHGMVRLDPQAGGYGEVADNYYQTFHVMETEYHYLHGNDSRMLTLCIEFMTEKDMNDPVLRTAITVAVTRLSAVMANMDAIRSKGGLPVDFDRTPKS